jgi:hypothetical protein
MELAFGTGCEHNCEEKWPVLARQLSAVEKIAEKSIPFLGFVENNQNMTSPIII